MVLHVRMLGQLQVEVDGHPTVVTAPLQRAVLASLALARGYVLTRDQLIDGLWDDPPANAVNAVQQYVSALRGRLGRDLIVTVGTGYRLDVGSESVSVDVDRFHALIAQARQRHHAGELTAAARLLAEAIGLWRGTALADVPECPFLVPARTALEEAMLGARLLQLAVEEDLGHAPAMVAAAETLASEYPLDEAVAAQLMRTLAGAGRTADALDVFDGMRARLAEELGVDPGPQLRAAQAAVLTQDPTLSAPPTAAWLPHSIPRPAGPLLGRDRDLADIEHLLQDPGTRLVTLTGSGGVGKTRLTVEVALRARRTREVVYVPLDLLASADLVMPTIAAALQLKSSPDADLATQIAGVLGGRDLLLVLDNFEHVMDAAANLARLLGLAADGTQILVTSRESLRIGGEHRYRVDPLATTIVATAADAGDSGHPEDRPVSSPTPAAVELFWQRAEAASPEFRRDEDPDAVARICEQLDGLPLAIELAAARTNVLAPSTILERLTRRLNLLTTGTRDAPGRQRSLRACLEWSVDLLTGDERRLFAVSSVFAGGATITSLEAVCGQVLPDVDILAGIDSMVAKSLLRPVTDPPGPRFAMLETIREYAGELLAASDNGPNARLAHAHHYRHLLAVDPHRFYTPPRNVEELATWSAELPNARAALDELADGEAQHRADLVFALNGVLSMRGFWAEIESHSVTLMERTDVSLARRIELVSLAATCAAVRGQLDLAQQRVQQGLHLLRDSKQPVPRQEARLRWAASDVAYFRGDADSDSKELEEALAASLTTGDTELIDTLTAKQLSLDGPELLAATERALATARDRGNQRMEAVVLGNASEQALNSDDALVLARAEEWARSAYAIGVLLVDLESQANGLGNASAAVLLGGGSPVQAATDLRTSLELARRYGGVGVEIENLVRLAGAEAAQGHADAAATLYRAWRTLSEYSLGVSPSNRRIIDTFLHDLEGLIGETGPAAPVSLAEAVEIALGERPLPPTTDVPAPSSGSRLIHRQ